MHIDSHCSPARAAQPHHAAEAPRAAPRGRGSARSAAHAGLSRRPFPFALLGGHFVSDLRLMAGSAPSLLPPRGGET